MQKVDSNTKALTQANLLPYKSLLEGGPIHIATVTKTNLPNLAVASDIKVLDGSTILISHNEMTHTPSNIQGNPNVVLTSFNAEWVGVRITGTAEYHTQGKYFDLCNKYFKTDSVTPKGAIVVHASLVESIA